MRLIVRPLNRPLNLTALYHGLPIITRVKSEREEGGRECGGMKLPLPRPPLRRNMRHRSFSVASAFAAAANNIEEKTEKE